MIIGIDSASTRLAVALAPGWPALDTVVWEEWKLPSPYSPQNTEEAASKLRSTIAGFDLMLSGGPDTAFLEAPVVAGSRNLQSTIKQSMVNGAIQLALLDMDFDVRMVPISTWKKDVVGSGGATKEMVREVVEGFYPEAEGESQDIIDALAVLRYGMRVVERLQNMQS